MDMEAAVVEAKTGTDCCNGVLVAGCSCRIWWRTESGVLDEDGVPEGVAPTLLLI